MRESEYIVTSYHTSLDESVYLNATIGHSGLVTARESLHTVEQGTQYPSNVHNKTKRSSGDDN